ncbi:dipeptidyl aminopeptidase/acylaminoacyl peptidase [Herbihabitans rhizosphaerae]|uniref:Dipeptidyl aminopeptidase/acylaminoacyl peptidase n=1 Tax=Herbihabitans rhizosphaerae TaxID=1872711 RepID=A0A4Q7L3G7_9PSEU|nr:prolyl oligopeptidase family serine peptidase [Herbihabitans rhizosphaerae]RZS43696.1 dipeptidyl aminopeptidase/acylaminoacyl peptidase [Herbihabitans rhizosphaerae]
MVNIAAYGTWTSPISAADAAAAGTSPEWTDLHDGHVWWAESRPHESGRVALLRDGVEVIDDRWNVRNRVHEYGGRPFTVLDDGRVAFTNWHDQRVYLAEPGGEPVPISAEPQREHGLRYGDLRATGDEVWCVRETITGDRPTDVRRDLVALPAAGGEPRVLTASHHFLTAPRPSPDGRHAAWIGWNHPDMPWDSAELCVAPINDDGTFGEHRVIAGGERESVCQFEWESDDALLAMTDPDGWWNLHRVTLDGQARNLATIEDDLGGPMWKLGWHWFAPLGGGRHAVLVSGALSVLDERTGTITEVDNDYPLWTPNLVARDGVIVSVAAGPRQSSAVVRLDLSTGELTTLTEAPERIPDEAYLPVPEKRWFTGENGRSIPAYVYPPTNPEFAGPDGELPPYLVHVHGGPTGASSRALDPRIAYFTSRGLGVVAVNYGGSSGYGRAFRELLIGEWGVVDVQDCASVAEALAEEGTADGERLAVRGGSAGGWTSAASMTTVRTYRCGTIMYPILDLTGWTGAGGETHDFESRYIENLVGTLPEHADRYAERSPINHIDKLAGPVLLLQGLEDEVCPPEQADRFVAALDGTGIPHAYLTFEGEQHGFRRAKTIERTLEAELSFYGQVFGFTPPGVPVLDLAL